MSKHVLITLSRHHAKLIKYRSSRIRRFSFFLCLPIKNEYTMFFFCIKYAHQWSLEREKKTASNLSSNFQKAAFIWLFVDQASQQKSIGSIRFIPFNFQHFGRFYGVGVSPGENYEKPYFKNWTIYPIGNHNGEIFVVLG